MRFVQLQMRNKAPFDAIIHYKCGPSFVNKRKAVFEFMLNQQSFKFWFRFWLSFAVYPVYIELETIKNQWPELVTYLNLNIYKNFLQSSPQDRFRYCMNLITSLNLTFSEREKNLKGRTTDELFECFHLKLQEYWEMSFAMALCFVFYKWLLSCDMHDKSNQTYWVVPDQYLSADYKPNSLDEFLVDEWREKLFALLGVDEKKLPWFRDTALEHGYLRPVRIVKSVKAERTAYVKYIKMISEVTILQKQKIKATAECYLEK